jgi:F0F1-type ATP synthase assembly protein I
VDLRGLGDKVRPSGAAADAGWTLSGSVIACLLIGYALGEYFDWNPAATLVGLLLGIVVGFYNLAKIMWRKK